MTHCYVLLCLTAFVVACQPDRQASKEANPPDTAVVVADTLQPNSPTSPDNFVIIPGEQVGAVRANESEASLRELLGAANVVRDTIYLVEGQFAIGTTLFKNTADQAQIVWKDERRFSKPDVVFIRPEYDENNELLPGTAGKTVQWLVPVKGNGHLSVGTPLREVERLNGKPFKLFGFGWDYGGDSSDWQQGQLRHSDGKTYLTVRFGVDDDLPPAQTRLYESLMGDGEFLSGTPALQRLNPTIKTLTVSFR